MTVADPSVADAVASCLADAGVRRVYGVPGEHCLALVDALARCEGLEFVSVRHESNAAFMAEAEAKLTGTVGACLGSASVGATNLCAGVNVAQHDSTPMLVLVGQVSTAIRGRDAWQEIDLVRLLGTLSSSAVEIAEAGVAEEATRRALAVAVTGRPGPVTLVIPEDVQSRPAPPVPPLPPSCVSAPALGAATARRIADLLATAQRPAAVAGGGVLRSGATEAFVALAERAAMPVATAFRRPDAFPDDHPHALGGLGLDAYSGTVDAVRTADVLLAVGTRLSELTTQRYRLPADGQRLVHLDIDPRVLARRHPPAEIRGCADARQALLAIADALAHREIDRPCWWRSRASLQAAYLAATPDPAARTATEVCAALDRLLPPDAVITSDAGDFFIPVARTLGYRRTRRYLGPTSGTMGYGLPAAIAAKIAEPARTAVAFCGDGGFLMSVAELATVRRLGLPLLVVVLTNDSYGSIRRHQRDNYRGRYVGVDLANPEIHQLAGAFGLNSVRIDPGSDVERALCSAVASDTATLVEVPID